MLLDIVHEVLGNDIEGNALPGIVAQAFLYACLGLLQEPRIDALPPQSRRDQWETEIVPVGDQEGLPGQGFFLRRSGG